jgi:Flp pilus assembly protein TadG
MAFVVVALVLVILGISEVGWAFFESSMITNAARDGARFGATLPSGERDVNGCIAANNATITDRVEDTLEGTNFTPTVAVEQNDCAVDGIPTITVRITGTMSTLFNLMGSTFDVDRTITFQDEGRTCPSNC